MEFSKILSRANSEIKKLLPSALVPSTADFHLPTDWFGSELTGQAKAQFDSLKHAIELYMVEPIGLQAETRLVHILDMIEATKETGISNSMPVLTDVVKFIRVNLLSDDSESVYKSMVLVDTMMKNLGYRMHILFGRRKFMKTFSLVTRRHREMTSKNVNNLKVYQLGVDCIQAWGEAFKPRRALYPHIYETYHKLRYKYRITFPRMDNDPTRMPIFLGQVSEKERQLIEEYPDTDGGDLSTTAEDARERERDARLMDENSHGGSYQTYQDGGQSNYDTLFPAALEVGSSKKHHKAVRDAIYAGWRLEDYSHLHVPAGMKHSAHSPRDKRSYSQSLTSHSPMTDMSPSKVSTSAVKSTPQRPMTPIQDEIEPSPPDLLNMEHEQDSQQAADRRSVSVVDTTERNSLALSASSDDTWWSPGKTQSGKSIVPLSTTNATTTSHSNAAMFETGYGPEPPMTQELTVYDPNSLALNPMNSSYNRDQFAANTIYRDKMNRPQIHAFTDIERSISEMMKPKERETPLNRSKSDSATTAAVRTASEKCHDRAKTPVPEVMDYSTPANIMNEVSRENTPSADVDTTADDFISYIDIIVVSPQSTRHKHSLSNIDTAIEIELNESESKDMCVDTSMFLMDDLLGNQRHDVTCDFESASAKRNSKRFRTISLDEHDTVLHPTQIITPEVARKYVTSVGTVGTHPTPHEQDENMAPIQEEHQHENKKKEEERTGTYYLEQQRLKKIKADEQLNNPQAHVMKPVEIKFYGSNRVVSKHY